MKVSQSVSGTLDRPRVVAPSKTCGHVRSDPPGVVGVEPSVVLYLLHPRSAGSSSLALGLRPDVRFTACASVQNYKYQIGGENHGTPSPWKREDMELIRDTRSLDAPLLKELLS